MKTKTININDLKPYENNAKLHTGSQIEQIKQSINDYGYVFPIVIDNENNIIAGHGRYEALKELDYQDVSVVVVDNLTDEQVKQLRLLDNKIADNAGYDIKMINEELATFDNFDFSFYNFEFEKFDNIDISTIESDITQPTNEDANDISVIANNKKTVVCPFCDCAFEIKE